MNYDGRRSLSLQCVSLGRGGRCLEFAMAHSSYCSACARRLSFRVIAGRPVYFPPPIHYTLDEIENPPAAAPIHADAVSAAAILFVGAWLGAVATAAFLFWFPR